MSQPKISLIICTRNRSLSLIKCLEAVQKVSFDFEWELILVNNNSTDDTQCVIDRFLATCKVPTKCLFVDIPGNGAGRNAAISISGGEILAFTDDDCYVTKDYLSAVERVFAKPNIGFCSGKILLFDHTDFPITINESSQEQIFAPNTLFSAGVIQGANFAIRRSAVFESGLFDTDFGAGTRFAGEDWELALRISFCGWAGGYFPGPIVYHHHGRKADAVLALLRFYAVGEGAVLTKCLRDPNMRFQAVLLFIRTSLRDLLRVGGLRHWLAVLTGSLLYLRYRS